MSVFSEGVAGKKGVTFFKGRGWGCSFYKKKINENLKYLITKKVYKQKCSVITKNLNCEILTKNLVTFKRWDGVKDEKF